jgi:hypothetical protein
MEKRRDFAVEIATQLFQMHLLYETSDEAYRSFRTSLRDVSDKEQLASSVDWLPAYQIEARC